MGRPYQHFVNAGYFSDEERSCLIKKIKEIDDSCIYQERLQHLVNEEFIKTPSIDYLNFEPSRNPAFRRIVLEAYNETCAICRLKLDTSVGISVIDAAHILPFSQFHNDDVRNGISLCKLHHWLFDHGLLSVDDTYRILVSQKIDHESPENIISSFHGKDLIVPTNEKESPSPIALQWHRNNVFD